MMKAIVTIILLAAVLVQGAGAPENMTVLETFPDGQAKHVQYTIPLSEYVSLGKAKLNPSWICPPNQIPSPSETSIISSERLNNQRCKVAPQPSDYIYTEKVERWLNPYGQTISIQYIDRAQPATKLLPETQAEALSDIAWDDYYFDAEGNVVSYTAAIDIPSSRAVKPRITFPAGYGLDKAMQDLGLTKVEAMNITNYNRIKQEAFNHSPEYMASRIKELESKQVPEIKATVARLNETVAQHATWLDRILNWIYSKFGVDLR